MFCANTTLQDGGEISVAISLQSVKVKAYEAGRTNS